MSFKIGVYGALFHEMNFFDEEKEIHFIGKRSIIL